MSPRRGEEQEGRGTQGFQVVSAVAFNTPEGALRVGQPRAGTRVLCGSAAFCSLTCYLN